MHRVSKYPRIVNRRGRMGPLAFVILLLLALGALAYWQGWLRVNQGSGRTTIEVETSEAREGVERAMEETGEALRRTGKSIEDAARNRTTTNPTQYHRRSTLRPYLGVLCVYSNETTKTQRAQRDLRRLQKKPRKNSWAWQE